MKRKETIDNTDKETPQSEPAKSKVRKALSITIDVVLYLFMAICIFALIAAVVSKKDGGDGALNVFGTEMRIVVSESMAKSENSDDVSQYKIKDLPLRSMVFIQTVPEDEDKAAEWYSKLQVGDVLTFKYLESARQEVVTHRIIAIDATANGYKLTLKGDNNGTKSHAGKQTIYTSSKDYPVSDSDAKFNFVIGKVTGRSVVLGNIVYIVRQPVGAALIIIVPCAAIIIWQVVRIVSAVGDDRKKKALAVQNAQEAELAELRKKIADLENKKDDGAGQEKPADAPIECGKPQDADAKQPSDKSDVTDNDD